MGWATSAPHSGSSHPLHHRGDHLQIQPRSLSPLVLGDRGALEALGVRWAQEGQLNPFLPVLLLVPFLPCCPAKGTRKTRGQMRWQRSLPGACKQEVAHPFPYPQTTPWDRTWMFPCLQGRGALQEGALPSSRILGPGRLWTAPAPHAMCTVATRGSSKIINANFSGSDAAAELSAEGGCSRASLRFAAGLRGAGSVFTPTAALSTLSVLAALRNLNS